MNILHVRLIKRTCHHCYSIHNTEPRLHTMISTVVHAKAVCAQKIHPIGNFFTLSLRSKVIAHWPQMSHFQKSLRIALNTSVFYKHFQVRFFAQQFVMSWLDRAAKQVWSRVNILSTEGRGFSISMHTCGSVAVVMGLGLAALPAAGASLSTEKVHCKTSCNKVC